MLALHVCCHFAAHKGPVLLLSYHGAAVVAACAAPAVLQYIDRTMQLPAITQEDKTRRDTFLSKKLRKLLNSVLGRQ
jgi:hypothetical protein